MKEISICILDNDLYIGSSIKEIISGFSNQISDNYDCQIHEPTLFTTPDSLLKELAGMKNKNIILLLDGQLGGGSKMGAEYVREIKEFISSIKIVGISNSNGQNTMALSRGADEAFPKKFIKSYDFYLLLQNLIEKF